MPRFKKIGIGLLAALSLLVVISLLLPSKVQIQRSITINASKRVIFNQINTLSNWSNWSPWQQKELRNNSPYFRSVMPTSTLAILPCKSTDSILICMKLADKQSALSAIAIKPQGATNKITWTYVYNTSKPFILGKYMGLFIERIIAADFEQGLTNLKIYTEK